MKLKSTIVLLIIFCTGNCFAQTTKVLRLKNKINFTERNALLTDTGFILEQKVWYNRPNTIDEEYGLILTINIKDTLQAKLLKIIDVNKDSSIIQCNWDFLSVWNWEKETIKMEGIIRIISLTKKTVIAELKLKVTDHRFNREIVYIYMMVKELLLKKKSNSSTAPATLL
jgi:hypothetical protein